MRVAWLKPLFFVVPCLGGVVLVAYMAVMKLSLQLISHRFELPAPPLPAAWEAAADPARVARGEHLVRGILGCANCHGDDLAGRPLLTDPRRAVVDSANLGHFAERARAADPSPASPRVPPGGDAAWVRALRYGLRDDGRALWLMPQHALSHVTDQDLMTAVAYLRGLPPSAAPPPPTHRLGARGRVEVALHRLALLDLGAVADNTPGAPTMPQERPAVSVGYGAYLATIGRCRSCHAPASILAGRLGPSPLPQGPPWAAARLRHAGQAAFRRALGEGRRLDGTPMTMDRPGHDYRRLDDTEVRALWMVLGSG